jgi:hypothetical protein
MLQARARCATGVGTAIARSSNALAKAIDPGGYDNAKQAVEKAPRMIEDAIE